jgi:hypothetical protein
MKMSNKGTDDNKNLIYKSKIEKYDKKIQTKSWPISFLWSKNTVKNNFTVLSFKCVLNKYSFENNLTSEICPQ